MTIIEAAPAKLNLALHVRACRQDGYHELETLFAFVRDGDVLHIDPAGPGDSFTIGGPFGAGLAADADNLVQRARDRFRAQIAPTPPLAVHLDKRLPIASGLGGGSADAAAMLRALARLAGLEAGDARIATVAAELGSDVPACLLGRTAIGRGRGETLAEIAAPAPLPVLLVNPGVAVATGPVFAGWDGVDRGGLGQGDALSIALAGRNDLEPPAMAIAPAIGAVLDRLRAQEGVKLARMSGSGATCFALFEDESTCRAAAREIRTEHPGWWCLETGLA